MGSHETTNFQEEWTMKQGRATRDVTEGTKVEPKPHAVSEGAVARVGQAQYPGAKVGPLYEGRGLKAPMVSQASHKGGSQGRY
jgi:hypothetical protein